MMSVGGNSMAGLSDYSAAESDAVQIVGGASAYGGSMAEGGDVEIVRDGEVSQDDINTSMAGLSDYSMSDVQRLDADDSIAELQNVSMAGLDSETKGENSKPMGNILDGLKLNMDHVQQHNDSKIGTYRSDIDVVYDEGEEYDSEEDQEGRRTIKKRKTLTYSKETTIERTSAAMEDDQNVRQSKGGRLMNLVAENKR